MDHKKPIACSLALLGSLAALFAVLVMLDGRTAFAQDSGDRYIAPSSQMDSPPITRYVAITGTDVASCTTPASACRTLQYAVDIAQPGDTIKVASGTFTSSSLFGGGRSVATIDKTITIRGGYTITEWNVSAPLLYPTVLDAQGSGRVLVVSGNISPTIEGFHITGGNTSNDGGGVYINQAGGTTLSNNIIYGNSSRNGGGVYVMDADGAILSDNVIYGNQSGLGGGVALHNSAATLVGNSISTNTVSGFESSGGGLFVYLSGATLIDNIVFGNTADCAGGLFLSRSGGARLYGNVFANNVARIIGGGMELANSSAHLSGTVVISNTARDNGGGIELAESNAVLINTVVADNRAEDRGAGIYIQGGRPVLFHSTIVRNTRGDGRGIYVMGSNAILTNTILAGNSVGIYTHWGADAKLESTLWGSGEWANGTDWEGDGTVVIGNNNYWAHPAFVGPSAHDYHIGPGSAAIDAGVNAGVDVDLDGNPRPFGTGYDIGADEYAFAVLSPSTKRAYPRDALAGEIVTFTITLRSDASQPVSDTILFDPIPTATTYISGSAQATSGILTDTDGIEWFGTVPAGDAITISFQVTIAQQTVIRNTAIATDTWGTSVTLVALVNAERTHLPLALRAPVSPPCVGAGEEMTMREYFEGMRCCAGLSPIHTARYFHPCDTPGQNACDLNGCTRPPPTSFDDPWYQCTPCGNGICEAEYGENRCNCAGDCPD